MSKQIFETKFSKHQEVYMLINGSIHNEYIKEVIINTSYDRPKYTFNSLHNSIDEEKVYETREEVALAWLHDNKVTFALKAVL